jgi:hypothetical protein
MELSKLIGLVITALIFTTQPIFADGDLQAPPGVVVQEEGQGPAGVIETYNPNQSLQPQYSNQQPSTPQSNPGQSSLPATNQAIAIDPDNRTMEQCRVLDRDGNGLIKAYMADSGPNLEGDADAWIWVPRGECARLNAGDYAGIPPKILNKINPSDITNAQTLE